jgi:hypothetical protein
VSVGVYACAQPQGTNHGASRNEEEYDEADGVRAPMTARAVGQVKKKVEGDGVVATSNYGVGAEAQGEWGDLDAFEALV